eukprot:162309-Chlamydomonas_euryale.AAC.2
MLQFTCMRAAAHAKDFLLEEARRGVESEFPFSARQVTVRSAWGWSRTMQRVWPEKVWPEAVQGLRGGARTAPSCGIPH